MAKHLGVSKSVVGKFIRINGLTPPREIIIQFRSQGMTGRTTFNDKEDDYIRKNYLKWPVKVLAAKMNRSYTGIMARLFAMGLEIPEEVKKRNIAAGRIQKGNVPLNKGRKMSKTVYEKVKHTFFKNGHVPANAKKKDGVITIRHHKRTGFHYKYIRSGLGKWEALHRFKWAKKNGPIPKGMCIAFKDGNTLNCHLSNLFPISQYDNRLRNSGSTLLSDGYVAQTMTRKNKELRKVILKTRPDLIELKRQSIILKRSINERSSNTND